MILIQFFRRLPVELTTSTAGAKTIAASADTLPPFTEPFDKVMASNVHMFFDDPVSTLWRWLVIGPAVGSRSRASRGSRPRPTPTLPRARIGSPPISARRGSRTCGSRRLR
jgi:hypothetical protein